MGDKETSQEATGGPRPGVAGRKTPTWAVPSHPLLPSCSQSSQWLLMWLAQPQGSASVMPHPSAPFG